MYYFKIIWCLTINLYDIQTSKEGDVTSVTYFGNVTDALKWSCHNDRATTHFWLFDSQLRKCLDSHLVSSLRRWKSYRIRKSQLELSLYSGYIVSIKFVAAPSESSRLYASIFKVMWNIDIIFKHGYLMKIPIESLKKLTRRVHTLRETDFRRHWRVDFWYLKMKPSVPNFIS